MEIGSAGVPIDIGTTRDYDLIFSTLAEAGISVFFPTTMYEEIPVEKGFGFESDFVPPPFGSATPEIYDLAREHGIKIAFSADNLFPIDSGGVPAQGGPLAAIINAGGRDIIHSLIGYDEPVLNGLSPEESKAVYEHVKSIDPTIEVVQVHAPVDSDSPQAYLQGVMDHAEWADVVGFDVYPINATPGVRTPFTFNELVEPTQALQEYMTWLETNFPDKKHVMVLQAFEQNDLHSDESLNSLSPEDLAFSRAPTLMEMRAMLLAVQDADFVYWWGQSLQETSNADVWQNLLSVSKLAADDALGSPMGILQDVDAAENSINEDGVSGGLTGIILSAVDSDEIDTVSYSLDDDRFTVDESGVVRISPNANFDFETEEQITILATAKSTDGTNRTLTLVINVQNVIDQLLGTAASDQLLGAQGVDHIFGFAGDDIINGQAGDDSINGGAGNDDILSGEGDDVVFGGDGSDQLNGGAGSDLLSGDSGTDAILGGSGADTIYGGADSDDLSGGAQDDHIEGGQGGDVLNGDDGHDSLFGGGGNDMMSGGAGDDYMSGGDDQDVMQGGSGNDILLGELNEDVLIGGTGRDSLYGGSGNDQLDGGGDADNLSGGAGQDNLQGGTGNDFVNGDAGNDFVYGGSGDDALFGGDGFDNIFGGDGADTLNSGTGNDFLTGGSGADTFEFKSADGDDTIFDFSVLEDALQFGDGVQMSDLQFSSYLNHTVIDFGQNSVLLMEVDFSLKDDLVITFVSEDNPIGLPYDCLMPGIGGGNQAQFGGGVQSRVPQNSTYEFQAMSEAGKVLLDEGDVLL
jgi:Ca2+-binding RTX toxin-like protein